MTGKLKSEIKQQRGFGSLEEEVTLNIARTAEYMMNAVAEVLKPYSLTVTQYNALRILRGAGTQGLMCSEVGERMVTKESDITRLLDRLESRGFISRERPPENRRVVIATIADAGNELLAELDGPVADCNKRLSAGLGKAEMRSLVSMLETIRKSE
jgi:DNA-binding MarR family transcriptional regulator